MKTLSEVVGSFLETAVSRENLLTHPVNLVVGVSGGPDSLALLHVLRAVVGPTRLVVAHLNHGFRETAVSEADFVQNLAEAWGMAFKAGLVDVPSLARETGDSLEEAGRKARYNFFRKVANEYQTPYIIVGHHADDQVETVLMNLLRGTGLRGLRGMLLVTSLSENTDHLVLRPFLSVARADIEAYCQKNELTPIFDESNEDVSFFRNRIRRELLPLLESYNAGVRIHLQQLAALTAAEVVVLDDLVADAWNRVYLDVDEDVVVMDRALWTNQPLALRRALLRQAVLEKRPFLQDITFQAVEQARLVAERKETGQRFHLPGNLILIVDYDRLIVTDDEQISLDDWPQLGEGQDAELSVPGYVDLANGWKVQSRYVKPVDLFAVETTDDDWQVFIALPPDQNLTLRARQPGERYQPLGMNGRSAKVKDVMINRKIGAKWRDNWPIVAGPTHLVWLVGHGIDERVKITEESLFIVQLRCYKG